MRRAVLVTRLRGLRPRLAGRRPTAAVPRDPSGPASPIPGSRSTRLHVPRARASRPARSGDDLLANRRRASHGGVPDGHKRDVVGD